MKQKKLFFSIGVLILISLFGILFAAQESQKPKKTNEHNTLTKEKNDAYNSQNAIISAQKNGQYLFLMFYDKIDDAYTAMETEIKNFKPPTNKTPILYEALTTDKKEKYVIDKYGISRAPLPLLLVFAPNGALTGGFPKEVKSENLKKCFVNKLTMDIMKPLQKRKVVLVQLQNDSTKFNNESNQAAKDFQNDVRLRGFVELVRADPADTSNKEFLKQCNLSSELNEATIVLLAPPGRIGGIYKGKTNKDELIAGLASCSSGCGSSSCSDRRFKKNISPIETPLAKVSKLKGVTFTWDRENFPQRLFPEGREIGLIAQDVELIVPEVVNTDKDGYKYIEYDKLTAILIEAVKEMKRQIEIQKTVIEKQGDKINELEAAGKSGGIK